MDSPVSIHFGTHKEKLPLLRTYDGAYQKGGVVGIISELTDKLVRGAVVSADTHHSLVVASHEVTSLGTLERSKMNDNSKLAQTHRRQSSPLFRKRFKKVHIIGFQIKSYKA